MTKQVVAVVGAVLALAGCSNNTPAGADAGTEVTKVGFIYVGPTGDYGWSKSHEDGRQYLENFGTNVKTSYIESVAIADAAKKIDELYASGHKIVFTTSFDYQAEALKAPERHPDLWMMNCAGFKTANHVGNYMARLEEAEYLSGMVAAGMSKTGKIGVVGALRIYEQMMHINAFTLGVRAVNPNAQVLVRWVGNWFSPAMEIKAVNDLVTDGGADVIKAMTDTNIPVVIADELKTPAGETVYSIGINNKDFCNSAKNGTCVTSSYYNWGPYYVKLVKEIAEGKYPTAGRVDYLGSKDLDIVGLAQMSDKVPADIKTKVEEKKTAITSGAFNVFQGPFKYVDGTEVKTGEKLTDTDLPCTKKFVEGITDFNGPSCTTNTDCNLNKTTAGERDAFYDSFLSCDAATSKCVAADLSGCGT
ncbi:MAG TPA: BMP family ABC transporter substrate-binding protein [Myxococcales bacterium]|jgi:basic membrane protein A